MQYTVDSVILSQTKSLLDILPRKKVSWNSLMNKHNIEYMDKEGLDLLSRMLIYNPIQRITAKEALLHPYFKSIAKD